MRIDEFFIYNFFRSQSLTMAKTDTEMIEYAISSSNSSRHLHSPPPPSSSSERRPQSRQELLNSVKKTISLEDLHEPQPFYENLTEGQSMAKEGRSSGRDNLKLLGVKTSSITNDNNNEPKSPLSIVTPFPMITLESKPVVTKTPEGKFHSAGLEFFKIHNAKVKKTFLFSAYIKLEQRHSELRKKC